jgi:hypothetical protein
VAGFFAHGNELPVSMTRRIFCTTPLFARCCGVMQASSGPATLLCYGEAHGGYMHRAFFAEELSVVNGLAGIRCCMLHAHIVPQLARFYLPTTAHPFCRLLHVSAAYYSQHQGLSTSDTRSLLFVVEWTPVCQSLVIPRTIQPSMLVHRLLTI